MRFTVTIDKGSIHYNTWGTFYPFSLVNYYKLYTYEYNQQMKKKYQNASEEEKKDNMYYDGHLDGCVFYAQMKYLSFARLGDYPSFRLLFPKIVDYNNSVKDASPVIQLYRKKSGRDVRDFENIYASRGLQGWSLWMRVEDYLLYVKEVL